MWTVLGEADEAARVQTALDVFKSEDLAVGFSFLETKRNYCKNGVKVSSAESRGRVVRWMNSFLFVEGGF